ncbi:MAG: tRNA 2-thiouridine(34) synthase MnmA, partial [Candidatus Magasanikbacteria bacterium]
MSNKKSKNQTVFVAMSGGVDSSVATYLLKEAGYDVVGIFMRCFNVDGCAKKDAQDARRVAQHLEIPFYVWDFEEEYKNKVVEYMIEGYAKGATPNPDVMCNREIKFGLFLDKALEVGADRIATGHYVKLKEQTPNKKSQKTSNKVYELLEAEDAHKDQSYFLWTLRQEELKKCLFPIGDYQKSEVRNVADNNGLPVADKPDSQGICFLGQVDLSEFLSRYIPKKEGPIVDMHGNEMGTHEGVWLYTIGQRRLGVEYNPPAGDSNPKPHYVAEKDLESNTLVMAEGSSNPALFEKKVKLRDVNFIDSNRAPEDEIKVQARIRYNQPLFDAILTKRENGYLLKFKNPQKFVSAGQSAVFYNKNSLNANLHPTNIK